MKYCKQCNASLRDDVVFCSACGTPVEKENNRCEACGSVLPEGATHCLNCDKKVDNKQPIIIASGTSNNHSSGSSSSYSSTSTSYTTMPEAELGNKSKIAAGILAILLGNLGIYSFYLGFTSKCILQLALTVLSCGLFSPIVTVWSIIDAVKILTDSNYRDAQGKRLK